MAATDDPPSILAAAARVPAFELSAATAAAACGRPAGRGARRFAAHDEDALTLAYGAAERCLRGTDPAAVQSLFVASTSWPRAAAATAARLAAALDLPPTAAIATLGGSWNSGAAALRLALEGARLPALVVAAERLDAPAGSEAETSVGDGAAAVLVGAGKGLARVTDWASRAETTEWESEDARLLGNQAARLAAAAKRPGVARAAATAPGARHSKTIAAALGMPAADGAMDRIGFCGAAHPLLALVEALESSRPGDRFLWAALAEGAEAATVEVDAAPAVRTFAAGLERVRPVPAYGLFQASRAFMDRPDQRAPFASPAIEQRDAEFVLRLHGERCAACRAVATLPAPVCQKCGAREGRVRIPLARTGIVFTFTHEHYVPTPVPPVSMAVVDLDRGGRLVVQVADAAPEEVRTGARVRLVLRRLHNGGGVPHYYWKAVLE